MHSITFADSMAFERFSEDPVIYFVRFTGYFKENRKNLWFVNVLSRDTWMRGGKLIFSVYTCELFFLTENSRFDWDFF
jgi:hypothetical protein